MLRARVQYSPASRLPPGRRGLKLFAARSSFKFEAVPLAVAIGVQSLQCQFTTERPRILNFKLNFLEGA